MASYSAAGDTEMLDLKPLEKHVKIAKSLPSGKAVWCSWRCVSFDGADPLCLWFPPKLLPFNFFPPHNQSKLWGHDLLKSLSLSRCLNNRSTSAAENNDFTYCLGPWTWKRYPFAPWLGESHRPWRWFQTWREAWHSRGLDGFADFTIFTWVAHPLNLPTVDGQNIQILAQVFNPLPPNFNVAKRFGDMGRVDKTKQTPMHDKKSSGSYFNIGIWAQCCWMEHLSRVLDVGFACRPDVNDKQQNLHTMTYKTNKNVFPATVLTTCFEVLQNSAFFHNQIPSVTCFLTISLCFARVLRASPTKLLGIFNSQITNLQGNLQCRFCVFSYNSSHIQNITHVPAKVHCGGLQIKIWRTLILNLVKKHVRISGQGHTFRGNLQVQSFVRFVKRSYMLLQQLPYRSAPSFEEFLDLSWVMFFVI